ncbi:GEVED domain-containing protein [Rubripirellula obstinata]|nr:GEVED domain-containing protein [Rubripirellula obstinata]
METLEKRQLLAAEVIAPVTASLESVGDPASYLEYGTSGSHWIDGSGLSDASIVETGDPVPSVWPLHLGGNSDQRVSRIRNAAEENTLTFDLGGTFDVSGMALWNSTERGNNNLLQTDRGFENTRLSYSTDGGITFSGDDLLTWTELVDDAATNQDSNPTSPPPMFGPEVQMLGSTVTGVTHVRMVVDNFSAGGADKFVMASELRFIGEPTPLPPVVIAPLSAELQSVGGSYLQYGDPAGVHWINGSGLDDATVVETGDEIPAVWPKHETGNNGERVSRIRGAAEFNTLTFDLGGRFHLEGMALWNSTEANQTDRGFEGTELSYSTDGGNTFSGSDLLTWEQLGTLTAPYEPEVQMLPSTVDGVTHVRMVVDNFSGEAIVMASELRFIGQIDTSIPLVADLSAETLEGNYNLTQGVEGGREVEFTVTLSETNSTGSPITFDLDDLGTGTAVSGVDYAAIPADAKIIVPHGSNTGSLVVNVIDDFSIEATETLNVQISGASFPAVIINTSTATGTIKDNDAAGVTLVGADDLNVSEAGDIDTYTIALDSIPTGPVQITATADSQLEISTDGITFAPALNLSFTDMTPQTITVRAVNDQSIEDLHNGTITHAITGTVVDANYPDVTHDDLYTVNGTDRTFQELLDDEALRPGGNWAGGVRGSEIDVNNAILEQGIPNHVSIPQNIRAHTLNASVVTRPNFDNITRWYQEDGKTQIYRVFEGEQNVRNNREYAARIETFADAGTAVWNDFSVRYTIMKGESMSLFQNKQNSDASWGLHVGMTPEGDIHYTHRRNHDGGNRRFTLAEDMIGKSFEMMVRDNGHDFELYFNGELIAKNFHERPGRDFSWRWGPYRGARPMEHDVLVFVNNLQMRENTSSPVGLMPYRLPTTSLVIDSATAEITDNDDGSQKPFVDRVVQSGTRIEAEAFDFGGSGVAYNDTGAGNDGNVFRTDVDVDIFETTDGGSGFSVGKPNGNGTEWMEYTADVVGGTYDIDFRLAAEGSDPTRIVRVLIADDSESSQFTELGTVSVPLTGSQSTWQTVTLAGVDLNPWAGSDRVIRLETDGFNFQTNWFEFNSPQLDFGDAPLSYGTLLADDGARHAAVGPQLGATRDWESNGTVSPAADGDGSDEDGVMFGGIGVNNLIAAVNVEFGNVNEVGTAKVDAWIDFNRNGAFELEEKILDDITVNQAMQTINYDIPRDLPGGITVGDAYARVRISTAGKLGPTGYAADGEVEDYVVTIAEPPVVESFEINGGSSQRSSVNSVKVTFDQVVDIDTEGGNPFQLTYGSNEAVAIGAPLIGEITDNAGNRKTTVELTFDPSSAYVTDFGSLKDGHYQLTIDPSLVTASGVELDGDGDGIAGDAYVMTAADGLFRKYGDADGTDSVGLSDFAMFRSVFGTSPSDPSAMSGLDSNGDGSIGLTDFAAFRANFGA